MKALAALGLLTLYIKAPKRIKGILLWAYGMGFAVLKLVGAWFNLGEQTAAVTQQGDDVQGRADELARRIIAVIGKNDAKTIAMVKSNAKELADYAASVHGGSAAAPAL